MNDSDNSKVTQKLRNSVVPFALLLLFFALLALYVARPLWTGLAWAAVLSFFTYPVYMFIHTRIFRGRFSYLAAAVNTVLIVFLLVLPMLLLGSVIAHEAAKLYSFFMDWIAGAKDTPVESLLALPPFAWLLTVFPQLKDLSVWTDIIYSSASTLATMTTNLSREVLGNVIKVGFYLIVITVASFFLTHDGRRIVEFSKDLLPLSQEEKENFFLRGKRMLYAIFYGILLTAVIQGTLGGLGWWFVGLGNPALFGALMCILSVLPFIGTALIWVPGVIYLFSTGEVRGGLILLAWSGLVVSNIDNILRPFFISEGSKMPLLLNFVGIVGGLATWGFLGLFLGPLVISLAVFFLQTYRLIVHIEPENTAVVPTAAPEGAGGIEPENTAVVPAAAPEGADGKGDPQ